jgi:hypothetical protein
MPRATLISSRIRRRRLTGTASVFACCTVLALLVSCDQKAEFSDTNQTRSETDKDGVALAVRNISELHQLFVVGMTTNQIISRCGNPQDIMDLSGGVREWRYSVNPFPAEGGMSGTYVFGVRLELSNGQLARVKCDYMGIPSGASPQELTGQTTNAVTEVNRPSVTVLKLFVVSASPIPGGTYFNTQQFPRLGYIPPTPNLAITTIKSATIAEQTIAEEGNKTTTVWSLSVYLNDQDARLLRSMTLTNIPCRILTMVDEEPVAAPVLTTPLSDGNLAFECRNRQVIEVLQNALAEMKRQNR